MRREISGQKIWLFYEAIHADKNIDYLTIHIWPKNWAWYSGHLTATNFDTVVSKTTHYIEKHIHAANKLGKPLVIEEFGLPRDGHAFSPFSETSFRDVITPEFFLPGKKICSKNMP